MNLFIGNLSYDVTEVTLRELFEPHGNIVSARIIEDRNTGYPKGIAFIEMGSLSEGRAAIEALNEKEFLGRKINVSEARPREPRSNNYGGGGGGNRDGGRRDNRDRDGGRRNNRY